MTPNFKKKSLISPKFEVVSHDTQKETNFVSPKRHLFYVLSIFKAPFEKTKQVSSTKLTNWYKNICHWKILTDL